MIISLNNIRRAITAALSTRTVYVSALLGVALVAAACSSSSTPNDTPQPGAAITVITTIYPVTYFGERIGGDRVNINSLVRPGVAAHEFEPTPDDIIAIRNADVLLYTDPAFEVWVKDAIDTIGTSDLIVVTTADLPDGDGQEDVDPHVWLNPAGAVEQARAVESAFTTADPEGAAIYKVNADQLVAELQELDSEIARALASCTLDTIVVSHEAYGHLAGRYGINQVALAGLSAEFESTPRRVSEIIQQMELLGIRHILQEPILSDDLANAVAAETGAVILPMHPLEALTPDQKTAGDTYFTVMRRNLVSLSTALGCD